MWPIRQAMSSFIRLPHGIVWPWFALGLMLPLMVVVLFIAKPAEAGWPGASFRLTVDVSSGGTVKVNQNASSSYPANYTFESGTRVLLVAVPAFGYRFNNWGGDLSGTTNPTLILIDCDKSITANFSINWPLVGTIIGSIVIIGFLVVAFIIRRAYNFNWKRVN